MLTQATARSVVVRRLDGTTLKGGTRDFAPTKLEFHLQPQGDEKSPPVRVPVASVKAIFFVKSFKGNRYHVEDKRFRKAQDQGRRIRVIFKDEEELVGLTSGYDPHRPGFFLVPADPASNNLRIFVVNSAVSKVEWLPSRLAG